MRNLVAESVIMKIFMINGFVLENICLFLGLTYIYSALKFVDIKLIFILLSGR